MKGSVVPRFNGVSSLNHGKNSNPLSQGIEQCASGGSHLDEPVEILASSRPTVTHGVDHGRATTQVPHLQNYRGEPERQAALSLLLRILSSGGPWALDQRGIPGPRRHDKHGTEPAR